MNDSVTRKLPILRNNIRSHQLHNIFKIQWITKNCNICMASNEDIVAIIAMCPVTLNMRSLKCKKTVKTY